MRTFQNVRIIFENRQKQSKLNLVFILIFFFFADPDTNTILDRGRPQINNTEL